MSTSLQIFTVYKSFRGVYIFVKDTHVFYVNNAGKAQFVWFRLRKDDEHLTSFVLGKYQQQEPRTKTQFTGRTGEHLSLPTEKKTSMVEFAPQSTHLQYLNLQINSVLLGLGLNIEEAVK